MCLIFKFTNICTILDACESNCIDTKYCYSCDYSLFVSDNSIIRKSQSSAILHTIKILQDGGCLNYILRDDSGKLRAKNQLFGLKFL